MTDRDEALRLSIRDRVIRRAASDIDFRRLLIDNPKSAIARELGIDIPDDLHVTVLPETADHLFLVLPPVSGAGDLSALTGIERLISLQTMPAWGGGVKA